MHWLSGMLAWVLSLSRRYRAVRAWAAKDPDDVVEGGLVTEYIAPPAQPGKGTVVVSVKLRDAVYDGVGGRAQGRATDIGRLIRVTELVLEFATEGRRGFGHSTA